MLVNGSAARTWVWDCATWLAVVREELDGDLQALASEEERMRLYRHIAGRVKEFTPPVTRVHRDDVLTALVVAVLVFLTAVPAVLPFLFIGDLLLALRVSNILLVALLFVVGYRWGQVAHTKAWVAGLAMVVVGVGAVRLAMELGG